MQYLKLKIIRNFFITLFFPISFFTLSCSLFQLQPISIPNIIIEPRANTYYDTRTEEDEDREQVLEDSRSKYKGASCSSSDVCEDICKDIYNRIGDRKECEELTYGQVKELKRVHEALEDPDEESLEELNSEDLDVLFNISIKAVDDIIGKYSSKDAERLLAWLAGDRRAARIFSKEDNDFKILEDLFKKMNRKANYEALTERLSGGDTFMDIAVVEQNNEALEWVHEYLEDGGVNGCKDIVDIDCFSAYCELAENMYRENAEDLLNFKYFEKYLNTIIEDGINGNRRPSRYEWDLDEIDDIDNLDYWVYDLCP